ncbi:MAG: hypothetical protein IJL20_00345 [Lachnospiraceae bacterium]|nr:hypothetical protein [Lachnospiraceae bacterium]
MEKEKKNDLKSTDKVYDSVFWTGINKFTRYVPMLVNEAFGEHFTMNAEVEILPGKQVIDINEGKRIKREVDALIRLSEELEEPVSHLYHFELETKGKKSIFIRIAQYALAHAFANVQELKDGAEIFIPRSAVVFLRSDSKDVKKFRIYIKYPGGRVSYQVPVLRIKDYDLDEIFEKKLLLLLPFYVFNITDKELDEMDRDVTKFDRLKGIIDNIYVRLQEMMDTDELDGNQTGTIMLYIRNVLDKLTGKRENVRKGVEEYMGGYIIETIFDKMAQEKDELNKVIEDKNKALEKEKIENAELKDENKSLREELEKYRKQGIVIS